MVVVVASCIIVLKKITILINMVNCSNEFPEYRKQDFRMLICRDGAIHAIIVLSLSSRPI